MVAKDWIACDRSCLWSSQNLSSPVMETVNSGELGTGKKPSVYTPSMAAFNKLENPALALSRYLRCSATVILNLPNLANLSPYYFIPASTSWRTLGSCIRIWSWRALLKCNGKAVTPSCDVWRKVHISLKMKSFSISLHSAVVISRLAQFQLRNTCHFN